MIAAFMFASILLVGWLFVKYDDARRVASGELSDR